MGKRFHKKKQLIKWLFIIFKELFFITSNLQMSIMADVPNFVVDNDALCRGDLNKNTDIKYEKLSKCENGNSLFLLTIIFQKTFSLL